MRNGADLLPIQLEALERQDYDGDWELIVVDNGSTDDTERVAASWADRLPIQVIPAFDNPGVNYARNVGITSADGDLIAFCDADDEVSDGWLQAIVKASLESDAVGGAIDSTRFDDPAVIPLRTVVMTEHLIRSAGFLPFAGGGNLSVWKDVLGALGGFNEEYRYGATDVEFCWRLQIAGYRLEFSEHALVHTRMRDSNRSLARQFYRYGMANPQLYRDFRSAGMPGSELQRVLRNWGWLALHSPDVIGDRARRGNWIRRAGLAAGNIRGTFKHRSLFL